MKCPSVKALRASFKLDEEQAKIVREICAAVDEVDPVDDYYRRTGRVHRGNSVLAKLIEEKCAETAKYAASCHNDPFDMDIWRVTMALHAIDKIVGGCGVDGLGPGRNGDYAPPYEYINFGDPYVETLIYKRETDNLYIGSWGSIAERHPNW